MGVEHAAQTVGHGVHLALHRSRLIRNKKEKGFLQHNWLAKDFEVLYRVSLSKLHIGYCTENVPIVFQTEFYTKLCSTGNGITFFNAC